MHGLFEEGVENFNKRDYFRAHESWEKLWLHAGEEKKFLQGLIQIAVAYHHYLEGNKEGAAMLLERGSGYLKTYPEGYMGIDSAKLIKNAVDSATKIKSSAQSGLPEIRWKKGSKQD